MNPLTTFEKIKLYQKSVKYTLDIYSNVSTALTVYLSITNNYMLLILLELI